MISVTILLAALLINGCFIVYMLGKLSAKLMDIEELLFHACAALGGIGAKLEGHADKADKDDPDSPDADERSEEDKLAEKKFVEGIYNILNYESKRGMGN